MAQNRIQIKRSTANAVVTGLNPGELAFTANGNVLYVGNPADGASVRIGGLQSPGTLTANQALVANATSGIDKIITSNAVVTTLWANGSAGAAGDVLFSNGSAVYWTTSGAIAINTAAQYVWSNTQTFNGGVVFGNTVTANGTVGTAGQVLHSDGTKTYWAADDQGVTSVATGNGLTGGPITSTGTIAVQAGNSGVIANSSGVFVNAATFSIATSQLSGDVALGTQTSGNYVATIAAGAGISGSSSSEGGTPTIAVVANNGIVANTTGVFVNPGNGLTVNATGVHITSRTFSLSGDVTGSATYDGTGAVTIATTIAADSVALGTDTTGNYVATITAGAGISGSSASEGGAATIAVVANNGIVANTTGVFAKQANGITVDAGGINVLAGTNGGLVSNSTGVFVNAGSGLVTNATGVHVGSGNGISVSADALNVTTGSTLTVNTLGVHVNSTLSITDLSLSGNLTVLGTLSTIDTTNLTVKDSLIELANGNVAADILDIGLYGQYAATGTRYTGIFRDASDGVYKVFANSTVEPTTTVDTGATGYVQGTLQSFFNSGAFVANATAVNITANSTVAVALVANTLTLTTALIGTSGGTGKTTMTNNAILVGNSTNGYNELTLNTNAGYVLQSNGTALVYDFLDGGTF